MFSAGLGMSNVTDTSTGALVFKNLAMSHKSWGLIYLQTHLIVNIDTATSGHFTAIKFLIPC